MHAHMTDEIFNVFDKQNISNTGTYVTLLYSADVFKISRVILAHTSMLVKILFGRN